MFGDAAGHRFQAQAAPALGQEDMHLKTALAGAFHEMTAGETGLGDRFRHD
jgi:hypothetical protein